jgi:hypothetical protein
VYLPTHISLTNLEQLVLYRYNNLETNHNVIFSR